MTVNKAQAMTSNEFHYGECVRTVGPRGGVKVSQEIWRRNGRTQTWKTRPDDFRVPVKWGQYGYSAIVPANAADFHAVEACPLHNQPEQ